MVLITTLLTLALTGTPMTIYDFTAKSIDGRDVALSDYRGKTLLIVNTASRCGYTNQYQGLEDLYKKYRDRGLVILGFPSNDFMWQEPGSDAEIKTFCSTKFGVTFPMFSKIRVKGDEAHPLYKFLTAHQQHGGDVSWNFNKFLIDARGEVVAHLPSKAEPMSDQVRKLVEAALPPQ